MPATLPQAVRKLFEETNFASLATLMPDGSPQSTVVWVELDGDRIVVNTAEGRTKPRNVRRDHRVAISVFDRNNPYSSAAVRGRVVDIRHDGADEGIDRLAKKYLGMDRYPNRLPGEQRVTLVIEPVQVSVMGS